MQKNNTNVIVTVIVAFLFGTFVGYRNQPIVNSFKHIANKTDTEVTTADLSPFWKVWDTINKNSPDASKVGDQDKVYGAMKGLASSVGDPYTTFFDPEESKIFQDEIAGEFSGVGMEIGIKDKILTVITPLKDSPSAKAGIKSGDKILKIETQLTTDMTVEEAIKLLRGDKGTVVTVTVFRENEKEPREIKITRDVINVPTIDTKLRDDGIFVISLASFSENSASLFRDAIKEFKKTGSDKLIFDLRGNPGGYLEAAIDMASYFLPSSDTVVIEDYGKSKKQEVYYSKGYDIFPSTLKFAVLIDGGSASASEIFAGAMQDNKRAKLVGDISYGKGSVQQLFDITPDTVLKVTIAKWLTPLGNSISLKGLTPDYIVPVTKKDIDAKIDAQMNKAVDLLNHWK